MSNKYEILGKFIKDLSSETPDVETYLFVREVINKYQLGIDINSKALKNKMIEINTTFKFEDKQENKKKSYFEIVYSTIIKLHNEIKDIWLQGLKCHFPKNIQSCYSNSNFHACTNA